MISSISSYHLLKKMVDLILDWGLSVKETREIVECIKNDDQFVTWIRKVPADSLYLRSHPNHLGGKIPSGLVDILIDGSGSLNLFSTIRAINEIRRHNPLFLISHSVAE